MAISIQCPRCGQQAMVAERATGAAVLCPGCGNRFTAGVTEPAAAGVPPAADAPRPGGKSSPRRAVVFTAVAVLVCAAAVAWTYRGHSWETPRPPEQRPPEPRMEDYYRQEDTLERQTHVYIGGGARNPANRKRGTGAVRK